MTLRRGIVLILLGGFLLLVLPWGPVQLSYVYSESMEPTIGVGDGYVIVPAGDVQAGDIVTFQSDQYDDYVTHRVAAVVDGGYVTQGDNNPSTDQAGGHSVVTDDAIVGQVLSVGGTPLVIPYLASIAGAVSTYWPLAALVVLLGGSLFDRNPRVRDVVRVRDLLVPLALTGVAGAVVVLAYSAPTYTMSFVAVTSDAVGGRVLPVGEAVVRTIDVASSPAFTYQFVEGNGVSVLEIVPQQDGDAIDVLVPAQVAGGGYDASVTTYQYPAVLPYGITSALHAVHPLAAALGSVLTLVTPLATALWFLVDGREPLTSRSRARTPWWQAK